MSSTRAKRVTRANVEEIFRAGISTTPETLPKLFDRLGIPLKYRAGLTCLMSQLVNQGLVQIVPGGDSERENTSPTYHRPIQQGQRSV